MALGKDARACGGADPNRVGNMLTYAERKRARGMLADKQGIGSIAEELECSVAQIQALADAKPKAVRAPSMLPAAPNPYFTYCIRRNACCRSPPRTRPLCLCGVTRVTCVTF